MPVHLRELDESELPGWIAASRRFYVSDLQRHAGLTPDEAEAKAARDHGALLRDGRPTEGNHVFALDNDRGETIGRLWFAERPFGVWL